MPITIGTFTSNRNKVNGIELVSDTGTVDLIWDDTGKKMDALKLEAVLLLRRLADELENSL